MSKDAGVFTYTEVITKEYSWNLSQFEKILFDNKNEYSIEVKYKVRKCLFEFIREYRFEILGNYTGYKFIFNGNGKFLYIENNYQQYEGYDIFNRIKIFKQENNI